jgi:hypothetical protein
MREVATESGAHQFVGGAKRSELKLFYHLVPTEFLRRVAKRYTDGAVKYTPNNWRAGLPTKQFVEQLYNHAMEHFIGFLDDGCETDDHLAAAAWGIAGLMEVQRVFGNKPFRDIFQDKHKIFFYTPNGQLTWLDDRMPKEMMDAAKRQEEIIKQNLDNIPEATTNDSLADGPNITGVAAHGKTPKAKKKAAKKKK